MTDLTFHHPDTVMLDERFRLRIEGVPTDQRVTVRGRLRDTNGRVWRSEGVYEVEDGVIDLDENEPVGDTHDDEPVGGTLDEADTMALIETMEPEAGDSLYMVREDQELEIEVESDGEILGTSAITRTYGHPEVTVTEIRDAGLFGELYEPPGDEPAPAVVTLHGSDGRPLGDLSRMLASRGFRTLALQYFDGVGETDELPNTLLNIPVEYVGAAVDWLLADDRTLGDSVGVFGISRGAELGLLAAAVFDEIGAVVSLNGSAIAWESIETVRRDRDCPSWTLNGEPLPYVPLGEEFDWEMTEPYSVREEYDEIYEATDPETIEEATIPVEQIDGPITFIAGGDDGLWNAATFCEPAVDRLDAHDHAHEYDLVVYEEAGHCFLTPYRPAANREEGIWKFGGTPAGYRHGDEAHWERILETLETLNPR